VVHPVIGISCGRSRFPRRPISSSRSLRRTTRRCSRSTTRTGASPSNNAKEFLLRVEHAVGRKAVLYSGSLIKEQLNDRIDSYLAEHRLWLAQYGPRPVTPRNWQSAWLWQFTGDGVGPKPHSIPGIVDTGIDINHFDGDAVKLASEWSGPTTVEPATA
jgi:GH25 family lysozyme M1 (1,4-beta-N-acetylmuramidase)